MRPDLELTSVPDWALAPTRPDADRTGRSWTVLAVGSRGADVAAGWIDQIGSPATGSAVSLHRYDEGSSLEVAAATLRADIGSARVGWRLMMAGPADACLYLRGVAVDLGVADDEMTVASTDVSTRAVYCVHCGAVTRGRVGIEETLPCGSCQRNLVVHYHVSRRSGTHLGYLVDAEQPAEVSA